MSLQNIEQNADTDDPMIGRVIDCLNEQFLANFQTLQLHQLKGDSCKFYVKT